MERYPGLNEEELAELRRQLEIAPRLSYYEVFGSHFCESWLELVGKFLAARRPEEPCRYLDDYSGVGKVRETVFGRLVAIRIGVVLFIPPSDSHDLHSLVVRNGPGFECRPLRQIQYHYGVEFRATADHRAEHWRLVYADQGASGYLYWQQGAGQGESYGSIGFSEERWAQMSAWLDHWLPAEPAKQA